MTISQVVQSGLFANEGQQLIRIPIRADEGTLSKRRRARREKGAKTRSKRSLLLWTTDEHNRFLQGLELYPSGPWKVIAEHVGTRTARQTMTHAQKYRQKIERRRHKQLQSSVGSEQSTPTQSQGAHIHVDTRATSTAAASKLSTDPVNRTPSDDSEHAVLLEFLDSFHPGEIDQDHDREPLEPLAHAQDQSFLPVAAAAASCAALRPL